MRPSFAGLKTVPRVSIILSWTEAPTTSRPASPGKLRLVRLSTWKRLSSRYDVVPEASPTNDEDVPEYQAEMLLPAEFHATRAQGCRMRGTSFRAAPPKNTELSSRAVPPSNVMTPPFAA